MDSISPLKMRINASIHPRQVPQHHCSCTLPPTSHSKADSNNTQHENNAINRIRPNPITKIHSRSQPTPMLRLRLRLSVRHIPIFAEF